MRIKEITGVAPMLAQAAFHHGDSLLDYRLNKFYLPNLL